MARSFLSLSLRLATGAGDGVVVDDGDVRTNKVLVADRGVAADEGAAADGEEMRQTTRVLRQTKELRLRWPPSTVWDAQDF